MDAERGGFSAREFFRQGGIQERGGVGETRLLAAGAGGFAGGPINLRIDRHERGEFLFPGFREFQADGPAGFIDQRDAPAFNKARAGPLCAVIVVVAVCSVRPGGFGAAAGQDGDQQCGEGGAKEPFHGRPSCGASRVPPVRRLRSRKVRHASSTAFWEVRSAPR